MYCENTGMNIKRGGKLAWFFLILSFHLSPAQQKIEKLGPAINSDVYDEISPVITRNGQTLYFTRIGSADFNRTLIQDEVDLSKTQADSTYLAVLKEVYSQIAGVHIESPVSASINQDIWIAGSQDQIFDQVFHPGFPINNALPNSVCSLSPDENKMIVINQFGRDGSMYKGFSVIERQLDGGFTFPEPIHIRDFYSNSPEVNLCMARDGDVILLSVNRTDSRGDNDLYVCFRIKTNLWSEPLNLGPVINTPFREITPFITEDKTTLLFASNRPGGQGGMDIYMSRRLDFSWTQWSQPELLTAPVNSEFDDSNPVLMNPYSKLYLTSRRDGTSDIFVAEFTQKNPDFQPEIPFISPPIVFKGRLINSLTRELVSASLSYGPSRLRKYETTLNAQEGLFEIAIHKKDKFRLTPHKEGFSAKGALVDIPLLDQLENRTYEIDFFLTPNEKEQKIDLKNIYFERGTPVVSPASFESLDGLANLLNQNPGMQIRIEGHTDSVGKYYELLDLSRNRSNAIKKYLVTMGIMSGRISTVGFGGTRPVAPNDTEENRAKNRRVEVFVTRSGNPSKIPFKDLPDPVIRKASNPLADFPESVSARIQPQTEPASRAVPGKQTTEKNNLAPGPPPQGTRDSIVYTPTTINTPPINTRNTEAGFGRKSQAVYTIHFIADQLALQQNAFPEIWKLIEFLHRNPEKKIRLSGMCTTRESASKPAGFCLQRALGIKEYLVYKSIDPARISISEEPSAGDGISGVMVFLQD